MHEQLKKLYIRWLRPAGGLLILSILYYLFNGSDSEKNTDLSLALLFAAVLSGLTLPLLYRLYFVKQVKKQILVSEDSFFRFQRNFLIIVLVTPYFLVLDLLAGPPTIFTFGILLCTGYALYVYYPSEQRYYFEERLFRVSKQRQEPE